MRALRGLGLSLDEIRTALDAPADEIGADINGADLTALRRLLTLQLRALQASQSRIETARVQITELLREIDDDASPDPDRIMAALEMMTVFDTYLTEQQREFLAARRADIGADGVEALKAEWLDLVERLRRHQQLDTPPAEEAVQSLIGRWDELAARFHGGDEQIKATSHRMWADHSTEICARMGWSVDRTTELLAYLARARDAAGPGAVSSR